MGRSLGQLANTFRSPSASISPGGVCPLGSKAEAFLSEARRSGAG